ncbi:glycosyltransferase [Moritella sp. 5]|uniref:glycosyltransferase family 4 protein n=1 Tax=Moritella sp. 5 TaxID=2746231 RepID=UPI001BAC9B2F|nr:glycosyltransferase [Moritella sp. 5]QUM81032.1 glycosyltransferase [Moritella sp. 5]
MKSIKLAFVTQFPLDVNHPFGGVEAVSVNLVNSLSAYTELDIQIVTLCTQTEKITQNSWGKVTIHRLPKPKGSDLFNAVTKSKGLVAGYVQSLQPDLIHVHDTYGIMLNDLSIPKVFTVHGFIYENTLFSSSRFCWLRSKVWKLIEQRSWAAQKNIISINPHVREKVSSVSSATIYDIANPIFDDFFSVERNENKQVIFTSSMISPLKNTLILVKATALLMRIGYDIELRIAGEMVNNEYAETLNNYIKENNLYDNIKLLGRLSVFQIKKELGQASIYALASLSENAPMGIAEAMAVGVPVVTSNRCGMPYMVRNGETGFLINPLDENNIANKFKMILDDVQLRLTMGKNAKEFAFSQYHAQSVAKRTFSVYQELMNSNSVHPN